MDNLKIKIDVEFENLERVISELKSASGKKKLSQLELAGIATYIHNFYNGIENILKQILKSKGIVIDDSAYWHKELIEKSVANKVITQNLAESLSEYLSFRHFFVHSYSFILNEQKLKYLHKKIFDIYDAFKKEIQN